MERETQVPYFKAINIFLPSPVSVSGGRIIVTAQNRSLWALGLKTVWKTENAEDTITTGTVFCKPLTIHHCNGQSEAFSWDCIFPGLETSCHRNNSLRDRLPATRWSRVPAPRGFMLPQKKLEKLGTKVLTSYKIFQKCMSKHSWS